MGQETRQVHRFTCTECGEDLVVALNVDYENIRHWTEAVENAEHSTEGLGDPIVNLDPNFLVPKEDRGRDRSFSRMQKIAEIIDEAEKAGRPLLTMPQGKENERPFRRPDYLEEWQQLKKTWSLHVRGRDHLVPPRLSSATETFYATDPLKSVEDWLWRFLLFSSGQFFQSAIRPAMAIVSPLIRLATFADFANHYNEISKDRGHRYLEILSQYFEAYDDFSQVHFSVSAGIEIPSDHIVSSVNFSRTKMYYGNAFEALSSSVDILAYLNNIAANRPFGAFQELTQKEYLKLDKPNRFNAFQDLTEFANLCRERDNQLRNASHHGGTRLETETQTIHYRAGKGGMGEAKTISYTAYLARCSRIHLQLCALLGVELVMCNAARLKYPL